MKKSTIYEFNFPNGKIIENKYRIIEKLGDGWESEVYKLKEIDTGIIRAAKFFYPQRNVKNKIAKQYALFLHKLTSCDITIHYHGIGHVEKDNIKVIFLLTEYIDGIILSDFLKQQRGGYIDIYRGLQLLYSLVSGLEEMHRLGIYHGDLHTGNIFVNRHGLGFDLKLLDLYRFKGTLKREGIHDDICDAVKVFYDVIGGKKRYAKHPDEVKHICLGLKRSLILKRFKSMLILKSYLENINWSNSYSG